MTLRRAGSRTHKRSPRIPYLISVSLLAAALASHLAPVAQEKISDPQDDVVRVETNLVTVPTYVTDARGARIRGLTQSDFQISDEGRPVEIAYFAAGAARVKLVFLLDASGSTREIIKRQRETATALLERFGENSRVAVFRFWDQPELTVPFTADRVKIRAAFMLPAPPDRRTAIFDAALAAVRAFQSPDADRTERRIVVLISDGLDTASATPDSIVLAEANDHAVSFYVVHLPLYTPRDGRLVPRRTAKGFRGLAEKTGGKFFTVGDARSSLDPNSTYDLAPIFRAVADDLDSQYVLGFYANNAAVPRDGRARRLEVKLSSPNNSSANRKLRVHSLRANYLLSKQ